MTELIYSALDAPLVRSNMLGLEVMAIAGLAFLWGRWRNPWSLLYEQGEAPPMRYLVIGCLLLAGGVGGWVHNMAQTYACRSDLRQERVTEIGGLLTMDAWQSGRPGYRTVTFTIDGRPYAVSVAPSCDCGFIAPPGSRVQAWDKHRVTAKVRDGVILQLEGVQLEGVQPTR